MFQKFRLFPFLALLGDNVDKKKVIQKAVTGIWKLFYHLQETIGAFAISLIISILMWFVGFLPDWSASLLAATFHNRIFCLIIYCVTSLPLFIWYYILVPNLPFEMITSVFVFRTHEQWWFHQNQTLLPIPKIVYPFVSFIWKKQTCRIWK